jgi:hypothetical protein
MNTTAARTALTTIGAEVEVEVIDFYAAGQPKIWVRATVVEVTPNGKLTVVAYRRSDATDKNGNGLVQSTLVGPRGGNKTIRLA